MPNEDKTFQVFFSLFLPLSLGDLFAWIFIPALLVLNKMTHARNPIPWH